jgi:hypothetical protein
MNTESLSSSASADTRVGQIHSSATPSLRADERNEDEDMHRTGIVQSERQVFELAREHFGLNETGGEYETSGP